MNFLNPLRFFYFHLLILQLEEYDLVRFIKAVVNTKGIPPSRDFRKPLKFTLKIKLITALASLLILFISLFLSKIFVNNTYKLAILLGTYTLGLYFSYIFLIIINVILLPIDILIKALLVFFAKNKIKKLNNVKIIGVAGSYGKTGMKDLLATVLAEKYRVVKTPESVNTPVGIARTILSQVNEKTEILVVEMGEYYPGDIKNICSIALPQISVITGINEAHLERLKSIDNGIKTIFEIAKNMKSNGILLLNAKDKLIKNNYKKFIARQEIYLYQAKGKIEFNEDASGFIYQKIFFPLLGQYNLDKIDGVIYLAKKLGLNHQEIETGLKKIKTPAHRLQPILNREKNILVIDDSYNGNPDGVEEAIKTLSLFKKRRKIFVTPGLVEMGDKSREVHQRIGQRLNDVVDLVILIKNSVTPDIEEGLIKAGFNQNNILMCNSMMEAQNNLNKIIKSGDVVLFQNDWPDNYV
ncbi:MAG: UDP-N-acetylmuramoyl-tripeptide-D-alanyl-D-alanine ligase [Candidatus Roizmanbacteria bacterium GW2011_GWA2_34_18]|uniref:UDP-N-acetylmuramoyl-tripeptide-D-alanyl-D-alanine ligase n=1 Tax=Candidatus Roizmanbacteria bacterium GW2011_GWA2_34_18 TaxID=1618477 RepID=A0A0G0DDM2_9BACT|nr:MAG: UDP-N-acetylmuramoyl-tripeptide-D-alanyl-D-alanine ligase [Candidatus Roizmanbacteria bacterium GW2011_GWA2_34_18]